MRRLGCWLTRRKLVEYLYGELSGEKRKRIVSHLEECVLCRKVWEEIKTAADAADSMPQPEPPSAFWDFYARRVSAGISENRRSRPVEGIGRLKKFLVPVLSFVLFIGISLGGARSYLIEQEITRNRDLLQNVEEVWNLDLVDQMNQDTVLFSEPVDQPCKHKTVLFSRQEIRQRFKKFRNLPVSEQKLILANYQKWTGYPEARQAANKRIYHILKTANHPALKKLK